MPIFDPQMETMPREQLRRLQNERLAQIVRYAYERVPFYHQALDEAGVRPDEIGSVDDITRLPFTRKSDLRDNYPFGLLAVPREDLLRVHASSGTTGKPTVVSYTAADIDLFAEVNARSLAAAGAAPGSMLHNAYGYGLFTGGLGLHYGGEKLGMIVVPVSGGVTERQITLILDFRPDMIACTPSYGQTLAGEFAKRGVSPEEISLKYAVLGAEPWTQTIREHVDAGLGLRSSNIYGLSEIIGPGVSQECVDERAGAHIWEDYFYPEVVDPGGDEPLPEGQAGELVLTTLTKEAMPLLRYRTGDVTSLSYEPCSCGRTHVRMDRILGRTDDMLIVRGINLYPTELELILRRIKGVVPHYQLVVTRDGALDEAELKVEVTPALFLSAGEAALSGELSAAEEPLRRLRQEIVHRVRETLGFRISATLMAPGSVPRSEGGKLRRVVDKRQL
ncbi:MAG TPA: phenylacetate--CoA ligase [Nitrolancea sp.]|nr:phenylacetate--CoA ligase [Nitrolancea sp.]